MASISATGSKGHHTFTLDVWENSTSVANNTSNCGYSFTMYGGTYAFNWSSKSISWGLDIGGKSYSGSFGKYDKNTTLTISSNNSISISHNDDGSKNLTFSFWVSDGINQSYTTGDCSANGSMNLTTIARASQPSCITYPDTTDDVGNMGNTITIHMNKKADFTHTVRYSWYSKTGTIATGIVDNCRWTIPLDFANDIPNLTSSWGTIYVDTYSGSTLIGTKSVKFTVHIPNDSEPVFSSDNVTYEDTNSAIVTITGDNQKIVQNKSNLKVTYTAATAKNGARISNYAFFLNGGSRALTAAGGTVDYGTVDSSQDLTLTVIATDSRGLTATVKKTVTMLEYSPPNAIVTLARVNNYEDTSKLTVDGSISSVDNLNTMTIKYRYKQSGGTYGDLTEISDNVEETVTCDKNYAFIFEVQITDLFSGSFVKEYVLDKGKFPLFIDTKKNAVGINEFPSDGEALRVKDGIGNFEDGIKVQGSQVIDFIVERGTSGIWTYRKWYSGNYDAWLMDNELESSTYSASGNIYVSDTQYSFTAPFDNITSCVGVASSQATWSWGAIWFGDTGWINLKIMAVGGTTAKGRCSLHITGKWK